MTDQSEAEAAVKDLESWAKRFTEIGIYGLSMTHEEVNDLAISLHLLLAERRGFVEALERYRKERSDRLDDEAVS